MLMSPTQGKHLKTCDDYFDFVSNICYLFQRLPYVNVVRVIDDFVNLLSHAIFTCVERRSGVNLM
jgi:hypothetical protein